MSEPEMEAWLGQLHRFLDEVEALAGGLRERLAIKGHGNALRPTPAGPF